TSKLYAGEEEERVLEATKRYFAEIMMPFRPAIRKNLDKVSALSLDLIAPTHGLIHDCVASILESHRIWVSDSVSNTVVVPYVSMHGSTLAMVDFLTESLVDKGVRVEKVNLAVADLGKLAAALVEAATIVIGSPTVLAGAHPLAVSAAFLANALRPKVKFASIIGSYGWGGKTVEQITGLISNLKVEILAPILVKGYPKPADLAAIERLAAGIVKKHRENNIV
ncbi:MAG: FprA family A-type flavoprotein, partial [Dehalococcoidia bacterium]|nr:FprA family A-type flavoprotein [Dehalococcoidia bacterium]